MRAFASGGSALTGTEAISNGVSVFRKPEARNARITMVWMSTILGSLVLGVGVLAAIIHPIPYLNGTPTVVSQIAKYVFGTSGLGTTFYVLLQASTMLILVLAANTSFTGFPYLASFAAEDSYLPRQLMKRGHRLVFSTGIIVLTAVSVLLLIVTRAQIDKLIPLYAIGVFTGFTMAGIGMAKYHLTHKEPAWKRRFVDQRHRGDPVGDRRHHHRGLEVQRGRLGRRRPSPSRGRRTASSSPAVHGRAGGARRGRARCLRSAGTEAPLGRSS